MAKAMRRLLIVTSLGCLLLCAGILALGLAAWAVVAAGAGTAAEYLVAVGLAVLLPTSFIVAGGLVPGPPRRTWPVISCPHCGEVFPAGVGPMPDRVCMTRSFSDKPPVMGMHGKSSLKSGLWDDELA